MANAVLSVLRGSFSSNMLYRINNVGMAAIYAPILESRLLYTKAALGLDVFEQHRERTKHQMANISEKFKEKMNEYSTGDSKNMIFTEDLKNMVHICDDDKDIELVVKMIKRYNQQNQSLRFGNYVFGPVVMRMFYLHNKPDIALECFKSEELSHFFDQLMSYQVLLDLLYENQRYNEVLDAVQIIKEKQLEQRYPKNIVVLAMAACYKLNSKESLDIALKLWGELQEIGHYPMRRAATFFAGLALNQGKPEIALEVLTNTKNQNYTTVRNIKVAALTEIGRLEDVIPILKSIINEDGPEGKVNTFNKDVIDKVKSAIDKSENPELTLEFDRLQEIFQRQGHISEITLSEQLCSEIQKPPVMNNRAFNNQQQNQRRPFDRKFPNRTGGFKQRPGLAELV